MIRSQHNSGYIKQLFRSRCSKSRQARSTKTTRKATNEVRQHKRGVIKCFIVETGFWILKTNYSADGKSQKRPKYFKFIFYNSTPYCVHASSKEPTLLFQNASVGVRLLKQYFLRLSKYKRLAYELLVGIVAGAMRVFKVVANQCDRNTHKYLSW